MHYFHTKIHFPLFSKDSQKPIRRLVLLSLLSLVFFSNNIRAKTINKHQAERAVKGWLKSNSKPFGRILKQHTKKTRTFTDANNTPLFHVVYLKPSGFAIISADDRIEPIIAVAADGDFDPSPGNPLAALVTGDLKKRVAVVKGIDSLPLKKTKKPPDFIPKAKAKWEKLFSIAESSDIFIEAGASAITDIRIDQLIQSKWSQAVTCDVNNCYNYWTPNNYPSGCVATAMAQLMRYYRHPTAAVGTPTFTIYVDDTNDVVPLRGGDGIGGPYHWDDMVLVPGCSTTDTQRQAIGALCYDAGVSVYTEYTSIVSTASTSYTADAFKNTFNYANAVKGRKVDNSELGFVLIDMINPNLDAGYPVLLGIRNDGAAIGHAVVVDGYGYDLATPYHHLNMGWANNDDVWYSLPIINTSNGSYDTVYSCIYNVFAASSGEIISGRVLDETGNPLSGAVVTANQGAYSDNTDSKGIYALAGIPSNATFLITVNKAGYKFDMRFIETGTSIDSQDTAGNRWGIDFIGAPNPSDFDGDRSTNSVDFTVFASYWMNKNCADSNNCDGADLEPDGDVDFDDLSGFFGNWLGWEQPAVLFYSIAAEDGRVWAQWDGQEWQGAGCNSIDTDGRALRLGDFLDSYSLQTVLSFDTSLVPGNWTPVSATLQLMCAEVFGADLFNWAGNECYIDVNSPCIGTTESLSEDGSDWNAVPDANRAAQFLAAPKNESLMVSTEFNTAGLNTLKNADKAQLKVYFTIPNYVTGTTDSLFLYSGETTDIGKKPKLIIKYSVE